MEEYKLDHKDLVTDLERKLKFAAVIQVVVVVMMNTQL